MYTEASSCIWLLSVDGNFHAMKLTFKKKKKKKELDTGDRGAAAPQKPNSKKEHNSLSIYRRLCMNLYLRVKSSKSTLDIEITCSAPVRSQIKGQSVPVLIASLGLFHM